MDIYQFYTGFCFDAYEFLGAHYNYKQTVFRTYAPSAHKVSLRYHSKEVPMKPILDGNFYEVTIKDANVGDTYEYRIYHDDGTHTDHCDPYGFCMELPPQHKSVVLDIDDYQFHDNAWQKIQTVCYDKPLNIYELHLGSWQKKQNGQWHTYAELADLLIPYLQESGYNFVEFMPISEHPCIESWGYQNTGFFAATSRYGTPYELMELIDKLHQNHIGVILDFVPVHFAIDSYGLGKYDGSALYEYPDGSVGISEWGSYNFMHSRGEVRSFLQSAANFWLSKFHFDGLRIDAISRIIYWQGDEHRGENGNAIEFLKVMNLGLKERHKNCILIAEDSTNYEGVTKPVKDGGLGFDYKWDMGFMHDTLEYFQTSPEKRKQEYHKLTFSMMYFYNERYLLPFSHDEVVHGKATILQKMWGDYEDKFPQARAMYLYFYVHPGKKLNFMGNEIGQLREWDEKREQDWFMRTYPIHDGFYRFMRDLNLVYLSHKALYQEDYEKNSFSWVDCRQEEKCVYAMKRKSEEEVLLAVFNFSEKMQNYQLKANSNEVRVLLNTDWEIYGGASKMENRLQHTNRTLQLSLNCFSGILLLVHS